MGTKEPTRAWRNHHALVTVGTLVSTADHEPAPHVHTMTQARADPYLRASTSRSSRLARAAWNLAWVLLFRPSPRPAHGWRAFLLRLFGARAGTGCHIHPGARVWAPWNLECEDTVAIADGVEIYNPSRVHLGSHSVISQQAYLCGATHEVHDPEFRMVSAPITV